MGEANLSDLLSGGGLASILQNPEVAEKLPRIMEALGPMLKETPKAQTEPPPQDAAEVTAEAQPTLVPAQVRKKMGSRHTALLHALEPYLSDERRAALSYILKIATLLDLVGEVL